MRFLLFYNIVTPSYELKGRAMQTPAWELAHNRREEALQQIRSANDFTEAIVTIKDGLTLTHANGESLNFPEYTCGRSSATSDTTATLLAVARFGDVEELKSYLKYCTSSLQVAREGVEVMIEVRSVFTSSEL